MGEVEEFDIKSQTGIIWLIVFGFLYIKVLLISLVLYLLVFRSLALSPRKNNPTILTVLFIFFTYLVDMGLEIEELLTLFGIHVHSTSNCRLLMYTLHGNKILQAMLVLFLLYYNWIAGYFKTYRFEVITTKFYPLVILGLLLLELIITIHPAMRVKGHESGKYCDYTSSNEVNHLDQWFYTILLPYWFPVVFAVPPSIYMVLKYKEADFIEPRKTQVRLTLAIAAAFFLTYLLYYLLLLSRELEALTVSRTEWQHLLGQSVWYITQPMFALIGHAWHICVPALTLVLDKELNKHLPRKGEKKKEIKLDDQVNQVNGRVEEKDAEVDLENQQYNSSPATTVVCIG